MSHPANIATILKRRRAWLRKNSRSGSAAVEFALIAPVFFVLLFGIIETGVLYFASATLQNAVNDTARQLRTGQISGAITPIALAADVCGNITGLISSASCTANLQVDLRAYASFTGASYPSITNPDGSINTKALSVTNVSSCQVVLFRAFYPWTIMTPLMQPLLQNMPNGQHLLTAAAAFRTEPYTSGQTC